MKKPIKRIDVENTTKCPLWILPEYGDENCGSLSAQVNCGTGRCPLRKRDYLITLKGNKK